MKLSLGALVLLTAQLAACLAMDMMYSSTPWYDSSEEDEGSFEQKAVNHIENSMEAMNAKLDGFRDLVRDLARQTMLLHFAMEERVRSDGDSGVKIIRGGNKGPENYYENGAVGNSFNTIHDHSNYDRTVGMGEVVVVLNGVEFRTRHNDYKLKMPSTTSTEFHATEDIPFPDVPPAVTNLDSVDEQIVEMREWFKAFATQNTTHRDYREFFKPIMCYMEGAWTLDKELSEPFESDRHQIDASSWFELQDLVRYASYTGTKSRLENFAYLPTTIMSVNETTGLPNYAQWNYRILCSQLEEDVALDELRQMDDLAYQVPRKRSKEDTRFTRAARFRIYEEAKEKFTKYSKIDRLFYKIPGKDNIPATNLSQASFGEDMFSLESKGNTKLKSGYYHRWFRFAKAGAMGLKSVSRGYNDANMWVAQTTQKRVAPIGLKHCTKKRVMVNGRWKRRKVCEMMYERFSYAIPLEIIYLTPLLSWNPYNIETGKSKNVVTAGGRNGQLTESKAFNGTDRSRHYITPVEFFKGRVDTSDPADTVRKAVGVLDRGGNLRKTTASGVKILLQDIEGVGKVRLRYPIAPIHGEGSPVWKELNALKYVVNSQLGEQEGPPDTVSFVMATTFQDPPGVHDHDFEITYDEFRDMVDNNARIEVITSESHDHTHTLTIRYKRSAQRFEYVRCGGASTCRDGHPKTVTLTSDVQVM